MAIESERINEREKKESETGGRKEKCENKKESVKVRKVVESRREN